MMLDASCGVLGLAADDDLVRERDQVDLAVGIEQGQLPFDAAVVDPPPVLEAAGSRMTVTVYISGSGWSLNHSQRSVVPIREPRIENSFSLNWTMSMIDGSDQAIRTTASLVMTSWLR